MKKIVFVLLLMTLAFANIEDQFLRDWRFYAVMAAFISVMAAVLLLMLARLLNLQQLEMIFKSEMMFAGSTVVLVLVLIFFIEVGEQVLIGTDTQAGLMGVLYGAAYDIPPVPFPEGTKLTDVAALYIKPLVICGQQFLRLLYIANIPVEAASTMYQEIFMSEHAAGGGAKPFASMITQTTKLLTFYMMAYYLLVHLLNFIKHYALFFLSVGVVLRAFPPTRGAGAYLMAISLALYFVFPFTFTFMSALSATQMQGLVHENPDATGLEDRFACNMPEESYIDPNQCGAQNAYKVKEQQSWLEAFGQDIMEFFEWFSPRFHRMLVANICLIPFVSMVAVITFVLSTTSLFGGMIPEIGRGLIKLV